MKKQTKEIKKQIRVQVIGYITTALGLVAALAWNEAIKELIAFVFPGDKNSLITKFIYALLVTALIVVVSYILVKLQNDDEEKSAS